MRLAWRLKTGTALVVGGSVLLACASGRQEPSSLGERPPYIRGEIVRTHYDGSSNDLLTAGLGKSGLAQSAPAAPDATWPEAEKLRRIAIHANYRALVDSTADGGFGVIYGPNVTVTGEPTQGEGKIAGDEFIAYADGGSGRQNVTMLVQVPGSFDPATACIVTAPSSGSRGVYGAIATAGEWGLKHGCAVAYTDKGAGTGAHDLQNDRVNLIRGERAAAAAAGAASNFTAALSPAERAALAAASPNRYAFKHAHSQQNPERDWGRDVLRSIEFAFFVLNEKYGPDRVTKRNTIVIASSVSNGGSASLRAAELDRSGLIDAVVVGEPNVTPVYDSRFAIVQGNGAPLAQHSRALFDYVTLLNVFQGCANVANPAAPANAAKSEARCAALREAGMLRADSLPEQAAEAQRIINGYGILPEQNVVQPGHWTAYVPQAIAVTYANSYGRFSVADRLCGYSFAAVDADGRPTALATDAVLFATSNGIPPTGGVSLINDLADGGPREDRRSSADQNLRGALCLRSLAVARDPRTDQPLAAADLANAQRIAAGSAEVRASGDLHGLPAIIITGRSDANLPPNHTSRAYFGRNRLVEGNRSNLRYIEVTNAQHLDVLLGTPAFKATPDKSGYDELFVPLHPYFIQAMDLMYAHLSQGAPLPPSQVVHAIPRGKGGDGKVPAISRTNLPPVAASPPPDALITFAANQVRIPE